MSQLSNIQETQNKLEESFMKRMSELEAQLQSGGPGKDTVARVAEEFRTFRELVFSMLGLLRKQIAECERVIDVAETRHRRKTLLVLGAAESDKEDCTSTVLEIVNSTMALSDISAADISKCHRIGVRNDKHHRPILLRFSDIKHRSAVWNSKTKLKGSSISLKEFLTRSRQSVFVKARQYFGMRSCWTQDGTIVVKVSDKNVKITTLDEFNLLTTKYPRNTGEIGTGNTKTSSIPKTRKN